MSLEQRVEALASSSDQFLSVCDSKMPQVLSRRDQMLRSQRSLGEPMLTEDGLGLGGSHENSIGGFTKLLSDRDCDNA